MSRKYESVQFESVDEIMIRLNSEVPEIAEKAIIDASLSLQNGEFVEKFCIKWLIGADTVWKKRNACVALRHLARRFRVLDIERIVPLLEKHISENVFAETALGTLEDIREYGTQQRTLKI